MKIPILILLVPFLTVLVQFSHADADLGKRMKARLPDVLIAKDGGRVGEGSDGLLHMRDDNASRDDNATVNLRKLVASENKDRKSLFAVLAKKNKASASKVAESFAKGLYARGKKGHWFKSSKGTWKKK